jgi:hypothetical protein
LTYWADTQVQQNQSYDYLIVADHGAGKRSGSLLDVIATGFVNLAGISSSTNDWNRHHRSTHPATRVYALPGTTIPSDGALDGTNNAGLRWDLDQIAPGVLAPGAALMYHVWRDDRENAAAPNRLDRTFRHVGRFSWQPVIRPSRAFAR